VLEHTTKHNPSHLKQQTNHNTPENEKTPNTQNKQESNKKNKKATVPESYQKRLSGTAWVGYITF
jgi:hypothetical protein